MLCHSFAWRDLGGAVPTAACWFPATWIGRDIAKETSELSTGDPNSVAFPHPLGCVRDTRGEAGEMFSCGGVRVSMDWGSRCGPWQGSRAVGFLPLWCQRVLADGTLISSVHLIVKPINLRLAQRLLKPLAALGLCWFFPLRGQALCLAAGGLRSAGDGGSRKRRDALGSCFGKHCWEWSRRPSACQDVCPATSPGQDALLCAFSCPANRY